MIKRFTAIQQSKIQHASYMLNNTTQQEAANVKQVDSKNFKV